MPVGSQPPAHAAAPQQVSWPRINSYLEGILQKLSSAQTPANLEEIHRSLVAASGRIEQTLQRRHLGDEQLTAQTRLVRGWIAFFSERQNLDDYLAARQRALEALAPVIRRHAAGPLVIHFRPMRGIYRLRHSRQQTVLALPTPMITFDAPTFAALARRVARSDPTARQAIHTAMMAEPYQFVHAELDVLGGTVRQSTGVFHDLAAAFDRVNAACFHGQMQRPRLTWSTLFTGRKFGHYDFVHDTVMISRTLDQQSVEQFVVDYVLYHELLHKKHGIRWTNGRQYAHTAQFTREEQQFPRYAQADAVLKRLAHEMSVLR